MTAESSTVGFTALIATFRQREAERIREEHLQREREAAKQEQRKLAYLQVGPHWHACSRSHPCPKTAAILIPAAWQLAASHQGMDSAGCMCMLLLCISAANIGISQPAALHNKCSCRRLLFSHVGPSPTSANSSAPAGQQAPRTELVVACSSVCHGATAGAGVQCGSDSAACTAPMPCHATHPVAHVQP